MYPARLYVELSWGPVGGEFGDTEAHRVRKGIPYETCQ